MFRILTRNNFMNLDSLSEDKEEFSTNSDGVINENDTNAFEPNESLENGIEMNSNQKRLDSSSISINEGKLSFFLS